MSRTSLSSIESPSGGAVGITGNLHSSGMIIQTNLVRTDARVAFSAPTTGNGTTITNLNLTITPKFASSLLIMRWMINCEVHFNTVFLVHRGGALITDSGFQGYNSQAGNVRWSGVMSANYNPDNDSTPENYSLLYAIPALTTTSRTYAPAIRGSGATAYTLFLNRTAGATASDNREVMLSNGVIWEVAQ